MSTSKSGGNKKQLPVIKKPYLKGKAFSRLALKRGGRVLGYLVLSAVLFFFLGQLLVIDIDWLRTIINLAVVFAFAGLLYSTGARDGEGDVAFAEIAFIRQADGREVSQEDLERCFHPYKGFVTAFSGALLIALICLVYALQAVKDSYVLGSLPSWVAAYETRSDIGPALLYYHDRAVFGLADALRMAVRLMIFPFVNMAGARNADAILLVERLSPLLVLIAPMFYGVGYARGEHFRAMIHSGIAANAKRAARKRRKVSRQRHRQEPRQLV